MWNRVRRALWAFFAPPVVNITIHLTCSNEDPSRVAREVSGQLHQLQGVASRAPGKSRS